MSPAVVRLQIEIYLAVQAVAVVLWWALLLVLPASRSWFVPKAATESPLLDLMAADLLGIGALSAIAGWMVHRGARPRLTLAVLGGCMLYATVLSLQLSVRHGSGWLGAALMMSATICCFATLSILRNDAFTLFQPAAEAPMRSHVLWLLLQIVVTWALFLLIWPLAIEELSDRIGLAPLPAVFLSVGLTLFGVATVFNIVTARSLVGVGRGTPVPTHCPSQFVCHGPYRWIRNPMALAGLSQGFAVGLALRSWPVLVYAILGGVVWHVLIRPVEERDLMRRFGGRYRAYRRRVGLWLPGVWVGK